MVDIHALMTDESLLSQTCYGSDPN